ncbi:hypothetical protein KI387_032874, partial [Taxus chinensis]
EVKDSERAGALPTGRLWSLEERCRRKAFSCTRKHTGAGFSLPQITKKKYPLPTVIVGTVVEKPPQEYNIEYLGHIFFDSGVCREDSKRGREDSATGSSQCTNSKCQTRVNHFDALPDDLLLSILVKLSSTTARPADLISALVTCKRFNEVGMQLMVLLKASTSVFVMEASHWSEGSHRFLRKCVDAGNVEACYTLGM